MPLVSREREISRPMRFLDSGLVEARREFRVWDDGGVSITPQEARFASGLPVEGDVFPGLSALVATRDSVERVPGTTTIIIVTWIYEGAADTIITQDIDTRIAFDEFWRANAIIPLGGIIGNGNTVDIGGTPIDQFGHPLSAARPQQLIVLSEIRTSPLDSETYLNITGTRNLDQFMSYSVGQLAYVGSRSRRIKRRLFLISHQFLGDTLFHLTQRPRLDQDRTPFIEPGTEHAAEVYWRTPYVNTTNFGNFFPEP